MCERSEKVAEGSIYFNFGDIEEDTTLSMEKKVHWEKKTTRET